MDAHVVLSPSFPFPFHVVLSPSVLFFEQKRDCLQFTCEFALARVWQASLENEKLGKKGRTQSNAGLNSLQKQPSFLAPGPQATD